MFDVIQVPAKISDDEYKILAIEDGQQVLRLQTKGFYVEPIDPAWIVYQANRAMRLRSAH